MFPCRRRCDGCANKRLPGSPGYPAADARLEVERPAAGGQGPEDVLWFPSYTGSQIVCEGVLDFGRQESSWSFSLSRLGGT